jgi:hypothetical protein
VHASAKIPAYDNLKAALYASDGMQEPAFGVPEATTDAILKLIDTPEPPLRLFLGKVAYPWAKGVYEQRLAEWDAWSEVSATAHGK